MIALMVLAAVVGQADAVGLALAIVGASFALGSVVSSAMRRGRIREEGKP